MQQEQQHLPSVHLSISLPEFPSTMPAGRSQARVYANVNDKSGRFFWDYGEHESIEQAYIGVLTRFSLADNLMVSWG